jgi:putative resolvase
LYKEQDVGKLFHQEPQSLAVESKKEKICYARVSSDHQKHDLERQVADLRHKCPEHTLIKEIGSGLNYKRKGFQALLERVYAGNVAEVVVSHRDRLCRYGCELVEFIFKQHDTKLVVLGQSMEEHDSRRELADDLLAVCNYFVAKNNGMRSAEN